MSGWTGSAFRNGFGGSKYVQRRHFLVDTGKVTTMYYMFRDASAFNQDIGGWNTAQVTDMRDMFYSASAFNHDISSWTGSDDVRLCTILNVWIGDGVQAKSFCSTPFDNRSGEFVRRSLANSGRYKLAYFRQGLFG